MTTLTEIVAVAVVHSSAAALSHFGVTLQPAQTPPPAAAAPIAERVVARTPHVPAKLVSCTKPRAQVVPEHV